MLTAEKRNFIAFMIQSDVLRFGEFTTKSGRKSPYFVNTGNYRTGGQLARLGDFYANLIHATCGDTFDLLFGPAYKGIPLATTAATSLFRQYDIDRPYCFNRKEVKDHGEGGNLIGHTPKSGERVLIIEDVITAGTAIRETMPLLRACGDVVVQEMFISVNRCEVGQNPEKTATMEVYDQFGITVHAIITVEDLYAYLGEEPEYAQMIAPMRAYMDQYCLFAPTPRG